MIAIKIFKNNKKNNYLKIKMKIIKKIKNLINKPEAKEGMGVERV